MVRFDAPSSIRVGDALYVLLIADCYDHAHPTIQGTSPLAAWLERSPSDFTYEQADLEAYMAARDALLEYAEEPDASGRPVPLVAGASDPLRVQAGSSLRLCNLRAVPATSSDVHNLDGDARKRLGLRAAGARGVVECVVGAHKLARVMEAHASQDGLLKVWIGPSFVEAFE